MHKFSFTRTCSLKQRQKSMLSNWFLLQSPIHDKNVECALMDSFSELGPRNIFVSFIWFTSDLSSDSRITLTTCIYI